MTYVPIEESDKMPMGAIIMWSGLDTEIPTGWHICDGTNGTPNLTDRFILGAGNTYAEGDTGGEAEHTLTVDEMPSHNHRVTYNEHGNDVNEVYHDASDLGGDPEFSINTNSTGGNMPHNNLPPYYALYYIMKVSV